MIHAMATVRRWESANVIPSSVQDLGGGIVRVPAFLSRTGVQIYKIRQADGSIVERREYRPPEEVFAKESLDSYRGRPVTEDHPNEWIDATNALRYTRGFVGDDVRAEENKVAGSAVLLDAALIQKARAGKVQVSAGYEAELEDAPGVTSDGEHYDVIQRRIRINHVAVVDEGRAGPDVRIRLDSADGYGEDEQLRTEATSDRSSTRRAMQKLTIDGVEYEVADQVAAHLDKITKETVAKVAEAVARADAAETIAKGTGDERISKLEARADALEAENTQLRSTFDARVSRRASLEREAVRVLDDDFEFDGKTESEIQRAVIAAVMPEIVARAEARRDDAGYIQACYDQAIEVAARKRDHGLRLISAARSLENNREDIDDPVAKARDAHRAALAGKKE